MHAETTRQVVFRKTSKNPTGMLNPDKEIFIVQDPTSLWSFKYHGGLLPGPMKQKFTSLNSAILFAKGYFSRNGLEIVEVKHAETS